MHISRSRVNICFRKWLSYQATTYKPLPEPFILISVQWIIECFYQTKNQWQLRDKYLFCGPQIISISFFVLKSQVSFVATVFDEFIANSAFNGFILPSFVIFIGFSVRRSSHAERCQHSTTRGLIILAGSPGASRDINPRPWMAIICQWRHRNSL